MKKKDIYNFETVEDLYSIEKRLLEIEQDKPTCLRNLNERCMPGSDFYDAEVYKINCLDIEKNILKQKRQYILDDRNGWKLKFFWNIAVPIIVAVITAYIVTKLNTKI